MLISSIENNDITEKIALLTANFLKDAHKYDFNKTSGYAVLPNGRIAYTRDNELFNDDDEDDDWCVPVNK